MGIAALFSIFAATFYWFPLLFGKVLDERLGKLHFYLTFIGAYATFLPMHFAGFAGNPRRYADFTTFDFLPGSCLYNDGSQARRSASLPCRRSFSGTLSIAFETARRLRRIPAVGQPQWLGHDGPVVRGPYEYQPDSTPDFRAQNEPDSSMPIPS